MDDISYATSTTDDSSVITYNVSTHARSQRGSLMDRGANGGIIGNDAIVFHVHTREVDVTGIDNHELNALKLVDASALTKTNRGPAILILRQYAYHGLNRTIHSSGQIESYRNKVDDRSMRVGGRQCITTNDGYVIPLDIINGLPYLKMQPHTEREFHELPHIILTGGNDWNPKILDHTLTDKENWYDTIKALDDEVLTTPFDEFGNYRNRTSDQDIVLQPTTPTGEMDDDPLVIQTADLNLYDSRGLREVFLAASHLNNLYCSADSALSPHESETAPKQTPPRVHFSQDFPDDPVTQQALVDDIVKTKKKIDPPIEVKKKRIDYQSLKPFFLHVDTDKIRKTFERTTQFATNVMSGHRIQQTIQSPYPANNVRRRNEPVASDTIYSETPAICTGGQQMAQIFIGRKSLVIDVFGMHSEAQFVNTLEDVIRKRGAMDKLITDSARVEISKRVVEILRALVIDDWQSEPKYQHQNFAEHRWKVYKKNINWIMALRNVDPAAWLLCAQWVADVMNHTSERSLKWNPPLQLLTGQTIDISILLCFMFWDIVYVSRYKDAHYKDQIGSEKTSEVRGRFVGFSTDVGHALTFKILTDDTRKILHRSRVRLSKDGENNLSLDIKAGDIPRRMLVHSKREEQGATQLPTVDLDVNPFLPVAEFLNQPTEATTGQDDKEDDPVEQAGESKEPDPISRQRNGEKAVPDEAPAIETVSEDTVPENAPIVETVDEDEHPEDVENDMTRLADRDEPEVEAIDRKEYADPIGDKTMYDLVMETLKTDNPTDPGLSPGDMIGRSFLMAPGEDQSRYRAKIIALVKDYKDDMESDPDNAAALTQFRCLVNDEYEEVVAYNEIVDYIEQDETWDGIWKFKEILDHKRVKRSDTEDSGNGGYKGNQVNVLLLWETGEKTWEPIGQVYEDDPVTVAIYADKHGLIGEPGWGLPGLKKRCKTHKRLLRSANQAKLHSYRTKPVYMFGYQVPRNYDQAMELDHKNGNTKWKDSADKEMFEIDLYDTFEDKGKGFNPDSTYKKIRVHMIFSVKHDGRHKARLVAGGHMTETPIDSVYSSVVSLRGIRIITFLAELNGLQTWASDVSCAYLEACTQERVYIVAGPEFGDRQGHTLIILKALYGLKSSGLRWSERLADVLVSMGFFLSRGEKDIWMRDKGDHYEYIAVYVDDLLLASKDPDGIISALKDAHKFNLKGTGPIGYHLGCDFFRDEEGRLCYAPRKYIEKMEDTYLRLFGTKPKNASSPLVKGDHPELDASELLGPENVKVYQSLIGALQWVIQIGRYDVATATMTMSRFRAAPRTGHMDRVKRIYGYVSKMKHAIIRIRTEEPDYSDIPEIKYDWKYTVYRGAKEEIPDDAPTPKGKRVVFTSFVDANLYHDLISGKSVTGIMHCANQTVIDTFSKLQSTVETATFGSEYVAARTCTEQIIDLRSTFRYLGVRVDTPTMMFGDNESVVNTAAMPHGKLNKRHNALSYHKTRSAIAAAITRFTHTPGADNPSDILSKHWDSPSVWPTLRLLLFTTGEDAKVAPLTAIRNLVKATLGFAQNTVSDSN